MRHDERLEIITERASSAMYALWSAMLTAHTVLLSVAVALPSAIPSVINWQFKLVGVIAAACMFLLLFNFAAVRMQYDSMGRRLLRADDPLTESERRRDISVAMARNSLMRISEVLSALGLVVAALLLSWVLLQ